MAFGFLNALMLLGLVGVGLPVLAHLISKRRFDVVQWGAMRFLELGHRTRRRIRLQDFLLLFLRMALIACVALALARPWGSGSLFGALGPDVKHDLVIVLDSSGSMAWQGAPQTPHQQAIQWIHDALESLRPGDTISLIDARRQPRRLIFPPTSDSKHVRDELAKLPGPSGTSRLPAAIEDDLKILTTTSNPVRRVVVLSDDQSLAWNLDDELNWERIGELRRQFKQPPVIDVVTFGDNQGSRQNFSVGNISFSRDVTVPEFPLKIRTTIRQSGGDGPARKKVFLEIDGQRIQDQSQDVTLPPNGEATVEFDHVFPVAGEFVVSVSVEPDNLPQDDRSDGVVIITPGLPVLIVDGDARLDATKSDAFYLQSVFAASGTKSPWIKATVVPPDQLDDQKLAGMKAVFLCNVRSLTPRQWESLQAFVREGGGLIVAPGDRVDAAAWNKLDAGVPPLLPAPFKKIETPEGPDADKGTMIDSASLETPWLQRFRKENGVDFVLSRFSKWWELDTLSPATPPEPAPSGKEPPPPLRILARTTTGSPLIVARKFGQGEVVQLAFPLDADWSTLPGKNDFVPFVYELAFLLTGQQSYRNVETGSPLFLPLTGNAHADDYRVTGPGIANQPASPMQRGRIPYAVFRETSVPGIYRFQRQGAQAVGQSSPFVVDDDRSESDLAALTDANWARLTDDLELVRVKTIGEVKQSAGGEAPRAEIWWLLLLAVLALLVSEAALTRRMVQGGHEALEAGADA